MVTESVSKVLPDVLVDGTVVSKIAFAAGPALFLVGAVLDGLGYGAWGGLIGGLGVFFVLITVVSYAVIWLLARASF